jgi:hypothetical protein
LDYVHVVLEYFKELITRKKTKSAQIRRAPLSNKGAAEEKAWHNDGEQNIGGKGAEALKVEVAAVCLKLAIVDVEDAVDGRAYHFGRVSSAGTSRESVCAESYLNMPR